MEATPYEYDHKAVLGSFSINRFAGGVPALPSKPGVPPGHLKIIFSNEIFEASSVKPGEASKLFTGILRRAEPASPSRPAARAVEARTGPDPWFGRNGAPPGLDVDKQGSWALELERHL
jgi:hypothetical protein